MKPEFRADLPPLHASFEVKLIECPAFDVAWHYHPHFELVYMLQSTGIRYVGDSMVPFDRGDLVLVGPNLPHCWRTVESQDPVRCVVVHWRESILSSWFDKPEFAQIRELLSRSGRGISFEAKAALELESYFIRLTEEEPFERLVTFLQILNKLATTSNQIHLAGLGFNHTLSDKASDRVSLINNYVKDNIHQDISISALADQLSMSKEAFCRFFKKTFGKAFTTHVNEYKITIASKLLIETDLSVSEVGYRSGFNNLSFFHRQFNRFRHMSPKVYQQEFRGMVK